MLAGDRRRKKDGGCGCGTTDLATIRYRIRDLKADWLLYVVDSRQALHFRLVFEVARRAVTVRAVAGDTQRTSLVIKWIIGSE